MARKVLCSFIVPTYNRIECLPVCIESLLSQYNQDWEAIIVNDAGQDVKYIVDAYKDKRLKYINNKVNIGLGATRNVGLKNSDSYYVAYIDQDDGVFPHFLDTMYYELRHRMLDLLYGDCVRYIKQKNQNGQYQIVGMDIQYSMDFDPDLLLIQNVTPVTSIFHKRELLEELGYFDETIKRYEDWDLWLKFSTAGKQIGHLRTPVSWFTWWNDSEGNSMSSTPDNLFSTLIPTIYKRYRKFAKNKDFVFKKQDEILVLRKVPPIVEES